MRTLQRISPVGTITTTLPHALNSCESGAGHRDRFPIVGKVSITTTYEAIQPQALGGGNGPVSGPLRSYRSWQALNDRFWHFWTSNPR